MCAIPESIKVLGLSGGLAQTSLNTAALRAAAELVPAGMEVETTTASLPSRPTTPSCASSASCRRAALRVRIRRPTRF